MKKNLFSIFLVIGIIVDTSLSGYLVFKVNKITSLYEQTIPSLYSMDYFIKNDCSSYSLHQLFNMPVDEYIVYFYGENCSSCAVSNEYLATFIYYGFTNKIDIYFVNVAYRDDLLTNEESSNLNENEFKVIYTPTMLIFSNDGISEYIGSDQVYQALDYYVEN